MLISLALAKNMFEIYNDVNLSLSFVGIIFVIFVILRSIAVIKLQTDMNKYNKVK